MSLFSAPNLLPFHPNVYRYQTLDAAGKVAFRALVKVTYDQLSPDAQATARAAVLETDVRAYRHDLAQVKDAVKSNLHTVISDACHVRRLVGSKARLHKLATDPTDLVKHITANLCDFLPDGSYVAYML